MRRIIKFNTFERTKSHIRSKFLPRCPNFSQIHQKTFLTTKINPGLCGMCGGSLDLKTFLCQLMTDSVSSSKLQNRNNFILHYANGLPVQMTICHCLMAETLFGLSRFQTIFHFLSAKIMFLFTNVELILLRANGNPSHRTPIPTGIRGQCRRGSKKFSKGGVEEKLPASSSKATVWSPRRWERIVHIGNGLR